MTIGTMTASAVVEFRLRLRVCLVQRVARLRGAQCIRRDRDG